MVKEPTEEMKNLLKHVKGGKMRAGKNDLIKHLTCKRITRSQAIRAKCYDCNGMGESDECENTECPLFSYSQFAKE